MHKLRGLFFVNSYVKAKFLTHDPERIASYDSDPLISRPIAVNILLGLYEAAERVVADAQAITLPTQLLISGADWVVHHEPQHALLRPAGQRGQGASIVLPGFFHDTLGERDRAPGRDGHARDFLLRAVRRSRRRRCDLRDAAPARRDRRRVARAGRAAAARCRRAALYWALTRASLRFGGLLSRRHRARPRDRLRFGQHARLRLSQPAAGRRRRSAGSIDRTYLDSIGWRGIRQRKIHVEELLREAMRAAAPSSGREVRLMDIAAGHGRYVLDAVLASPVKRRARSCCATTATSTCATAAR